MTAPEDSALMLEVTSVPDTNLVALSAAASNPEQLAPLGNARVEGYPDLLQQKLERDGNEAPRHSYIAFVVR